MEFLDGQSVTAIVAAVISVITVGVVAGMKKVKEFVKSTKTTYDDKVYNAVVRAVQDAGVIEKKEEKEDGTNG